MPTQPGTGSGDGPDTDAAHSAAAIHSADPAGPELDLSVLDGLAERTLPEHAAAYDELHAQLQSALNQIERS
jgi:hypothetical protein